MRQRQAATDVLLAAVRLGCRGLGLKGLEAGRKAALGLPEGCCSREPMESWSSKGPPSEKRMD